MLVFGLSGATERQGPFTEEHERARAELTESQNRARLHDEREFLPRILPEEVHSQIERELLDTWHAIGFSLSTASHCWFFCFLYLHESGSN